MLLRDHDSRPLIIHAGAPFDERGDLNGNYLVEVMDIIGLDSSDGLLNRFLYGMDV